MAKAKRLYILGTRGIPANYGGFETFAEYLSLHLVKNGWDVTVYCQKEEATPDITEDIWNGVKRVHVAPYVEAFKKNIGGSLGTAIFDWRALFHAKGQPEGIFLTLGYNTGAFNLLPRFFWKRKQIINMDGIEWQRSKWSWFHKLCFRINYKLAGIAGNILIADNPGIQRLLAQHFDPRKIRMIAYGAPPITQADASHLLPFKLNQQRYVTLIARPEPENNILPLVKSWSKRRRGIKLIVLGTYQTNNAYHRQVRAAASDEVIFLGAIYKKEIVQALRLHALAYLHGHSVGGTNPSLVEALAAGNPVIAHDNEFNSWVAGPAAIYFHNEQQLDYVFDHLFNNTGQIDMMRENARQRHAQAFQWPFILGQYEEALEQLV